MRAKLISKGRVSLPITLTAIFAVAITFTLNACGPSKAELAIMAMPSVGEASGLWNKLIWLEGNVQSGGNYVLEIEDTDKIYVKRYLSYKNVTNVTITLKGAGANGIINNSFIVGSGVTLILENITLKDGYDYWPPSVEVDTGGTLIMNDGSAITGKTISNDKNRVYSCGQLIKTYGAGVRVNSGGTFIMKGGTIYGNTIQLHYGLGFNVVSVRDGKCTYNFNPLGAGVHIDYGGTFIKTGGTITCYSSDPESGNVIRDTEGNVLNGFGHAISFGTPKGEEPKAIDTTIGPEITINFKNGIFSEGRNEEAKLQEATAEPVEPQMPPQGE
ncbi:MAG: hypothetical protein LBH25_12305 [Fibromonadaceae bacterium]|jgi:hypothetical protein|nr:hypothetical protein [Fibromonadaceae bacterium]